MSDGDAARMRFGFVVLHYLAADETRACVQSVLALEGDAFDVQVIVVDNASPNGSGVQLQDEYASDSRIDVLLGEANEGFARGNNRGYRMMRDTYDPDFIVVMNNDIVIEDRAFLEKVVQAYADEPFGVLGPDVFCPKTGKHQSPSHVRIPTLSRIEQQLAEYAQANADFNAYFRTVKRAERIKRAKDALRPAYHALRGALRGQRPSRPSASPVQSGMQPHEKAQANVVLHGSCYIFSRDFIAVRQNAFNPATFLYFEEDILAYECLRDGILMRYDPTLRVLHNEDAATNMAYKTERARMALKFREKACSMEVLAAQMRADRDALQARAVLRVSPDSGLLLEHIGDGYAGNAVNVMPFRHGAMASWCEGRATQVFCAFYDRDGQIVAAHHDGESWGIQPTGFQGNPADAHNAISLVVDGAGYVHMAWANHNGALAYARSSRPLCASFEQRDIPGFSGRRITYPEFYRQPSGDVLLLCRDGQSGSGDLMLARYGVSSELWRLRSEALVSGEGACSPYWQACVDAQGRLHVSWTWRDSSDANSNHDVCYLVSSDEACDAFLDGRGESVALPCTPASSVPIVDIPVGSGLLNQTSMTCDRLGNPAIAILWRNKSCMQYGIVSKRDASWRLCDTGIRSTDFAVRGRGTRRLPCSRPLLLAKATEDPELILVFRDDERGGGICVAHLCGQGDAWICRGIDTLVSQDVGSWEPNCDIAVWEARGELSMLVQYALYCPDNRHLLELETPCYALSVPLDFE